MIRVFDLSVFYLVASVIKALTSTFLLVCGRSKFPSKRMNDCRGRVVGGKEASKGSQPWIAAIYRDGKFVCGGSLINDEWVLTGFILMSYLQFEQIVHSFT